MTKMLNDAAVGIAIIMGIIGLVTTTMCVYNGTFLIGGIIMMLASGWIIGDESE